MRAHIMTSIFQQFALQHNPANVLRSAYTNSRAQQLIWEGMDLHLAAGLALLLLQVLKLAEQDSQRKSPLSRAILSKQEQVQNALHPHTNVVPTRHKLRTISIN